MPNPNIVRRAVRSLSGIKFSPDGPLHTVTVNPDGADTRYVEGPGVPSVDHFDRLMNWLKSLWQIRTFSRTQKWGLVEYEQLLNSRGETRTHSLSRTTPDGVHLTTEINAEALSFYLTARAPEFSILQYLNLTLPKSAIAIVAANHLLGTVGSFENREAWKDIRCSLKGVFSADALMEAFKSLFPAWVMTSQEDDRMGTFEVKPFHQEIRYAHPEKGVNFCPSGPTLTDQISTNTTPFYASTIAAGEHSAVLGRLVHQPVFEVVENVRGWEPMKDPLHAPFSPGIVDLVRAAAVLKPNLPVAM